MSDQLGPIFLPTPVNSNLTFPLVSDYAYSMTQPNPVIVHQFGDLAALGKQRYKAGIGPVRHTFRRQVLSRKDAGLLRDFYESVQGSYQSFTYNVPQADQTFVPKQVVFDFTGITFPQFANDVQNVGVTFVEVQDGSGFSIQAPYPINSTVTRFPTDALAIALSQQEQEIIPLVHVKVRDSSVSDMYISDRRVTVGNNLYVAKLQDIGEPGASKPVMTQTITGSADNVTFSFGNTDRAMTKLANSCELMFAQIDLSLYHVQTGILIQLWKGFVQSYEMNSSPIFTMKCSDGMYSITKPYPVRQITHPCAWVFDDGLNCPFQAHGTLGAEASGTSCSYNDDDSGVGNPDIGNGCLQHAKGISADGATNPGMTKYFGGVPIIQQGVKVLDNSTGFLGFDRNSVNTTSIVSDSIWGQPLPEIWCNDDGVALNAFYANCLVGDVRVQGDFMDVLGIVGVGPIGLYTGMQSYTDPTTGYVTFVCPRADGFFPQGFKVNSQNVITSDTTAGLREVAGTHPTDQSATDDRILLGAGGKINGHNRAAGVAFLDLIYSIPSSVDPTIPESHTLVVPISQGLSGWTWTADGTRTLVSGLTNPAWIAVNMYLRALGLFNADSATQQNYFVLSSLANEDTVSGSADICDLVVDALLGGGTEKQFRFMGTFAEAKPLRDWLGEVMQCFNGYYSFEFGKLKIGIRENAASVSAFTRGNMLYQSLSLQPIQAKYEKMTINFADKAYQYQANQGSYEDKDHEIYYGRPSAPLTATKTCVGVSSLSQAARIAITVTREELGGISGSNTNNNGTDIDASEWRTAREGSWKTTLLALETEAGQVVSVTHPDIPGKQGQVSVAGLDVTWVSGDKFQNYSGDTTLVDKDIVIGGVTVTVTAVTDATHLTVDEAPGNADSIAFEVTTMCFRITSWSLMKDWSIQIQGRTVVDSMYQFDIGPKPVDVTPPKLPVMFYPEPLGVWAPFQTQYSGSDAIFPNEWTFDAQEVFDQNADNSAQAYIVVTGKEPANQFLQNVGAPSIGGSSTVTVNTTGGSIKGGTNYRIAICGRDSDGVCTPPSEIRIVSVPSGTDTNQMVINNIIWPNTAGIVDCAFFASDDDDLICNQAIISLTDTSGTITPTTITIDGPFARSTWALPNPNSKSVRLKPKKLIHAGVNGVGVTSVSGSTLVSDDCVDSALTDDWTGRKLIVIGRQTGSIPLQNFNITDFDPSTGTFTLDRDCSMLGKDDVFSVSFLGYDNSSAPTVFTDTGISNAENGHVGLVTNQDQGHIMRVWGGTGRGQKAKILSNTSDSYTLDQPLTLDTDSIVWVEDSVWGPSADSTQYATSGSLLESNINVPTTNFLKQSLVVGGYTVDAVGTEADDINSPVRPVYIYGTLANVQTPQMTLEITGQDNQLVVGDDDNPSAGPTIMKSTGVLSAWEANAYFPPSGDAIFVDIKRSTDGGATYASIFTGAGSGVVIPDGVATTQIGTTFNGTISVNTGDLFYAVVNQIGSTNPGGRLTINLYLVPSDATNIVTP